jgi:hypothetical protein
LLLSYVKSHHVTFVYNFSAAVMSKETIEVEIRKLESRKAESKRMLLHWTIRPVL